jgi:predicted transposase YbfD/YdcC
VTNDVYLHAHWIQDSHNREEEINKRPTHALHTPQSIVHNQEEDVAPEPYSTTEEVIKGKKQAKERVLTLNLPIQVIEEATARRRRNQARHQSHQQ